MSAPAGSWCCSGPARCGVVVTNGGYARIAGHTEGLLVAVGGHASLTGTCHGPAINDGGYLSIEGTVDGPIVAYAGETTRDVGGNVVAPGRTALASADAGERRGGPYGGRGR